MTVILSNVAEMPLRAIEFSGRNVHFTERSHSGRHDRCHSAVLDERTAEFDRRTISERNSMFFKAVFLSLMDRQNALM
jgi:hypothetical protein